METVTEIRENEIFISKEFYAMLKCIVDNKACNEVFKYIYIDSDNSINYTDGHRLVHIKHIGHLKNGYYNLKKKDKIHYLEYVNIDNLTYPNYKKIIDNCNINLFNHLYIDKDNDSKILFQLGIYCQATINYRYLKPLLKQKWNITRNNRIPSQSIKFISNDITYVVANLCNEIDTSVYFK